MGDSALLTSDDRQSTLSALVAAGQADLADRLRHSWTEEARTIRIAEALSARREIDTILPKAVEALDKLAEAELLREQRRSAEWEVEQSARTRVSRALWGREGVVLMIVSAAVSVSGTIAAFYFAGAAP